MTPNYLTSLRCKCRLVSLNLINLGFVVQSCCMYDFFFLEYEGELLIIVLIEEKVFT